MGARGRYGTWTWIRIRSPIRYTSESGSFAGGHSGAVPCQYDTTVLYPSNERVLCTVFSATRGVIDTGIYRYDTIRVQLQLCKTYCELDRCLTLAGIQSATSTRTPSEEQPDGRSGEGEIGEIISLAHWHSRQVIK